MKLVDELKLFLNEAKTKATTYVGLLIASAGELRAQWPEFIDKLPHWRWLVTIENHTFTALGLLVVYTRVRRLLKDAK